MSALTNVSTKAIGVDSEGYKFGRAMMAPKTVCIQWGTPDGTHKVVVGHALVSECIRWMFTEGNFDQVWGHNLPYDIATFLEWFPEHADLIWAALERLEVFDTMYLERLGQIATGTAGPLGLALVAPKYGLPAPDKQIEAAHPDFPGEVFDVRTSFALWDDAEAIPEPWHHYADYDGVVTIQLADRLVKRYCVAPPGQKYPLVPLKLVAEMTRKYVCLGLSRVYGLRVNPDAVGALRKAAHGALLRLREVALENALITPVPATRKQVAAGLRDADVFCPVKLERRPEAKLDPKAKLNHDPAKLAAKQAQWEKRQAKHANCPGCKYQARDAVTGELVFKKNTDVLKALVSEAYEGKPPITQAKKGKDGKKTGGGNISTSKDTLQDSQDERLERWSEYNEWATLMSKDMKIFEHSPVHTNFGLANTGRPTSYDPNILNFRRTSFYIATCPNTESCGYEMTLDPRDLPKPGAVLLCPFCDAAVA